MSDSTVASIMLSAMTLVDSRRSTGNPVADELERAFDLPPREYTPTGMRTEIYFTLHTQFKHSIPFMPLERGANRRQLSVFSIGQYTQCTRDEFSITCNDLLYLNLRLHRPSIGHITVIGNSDEDYLEMPLLFNPSAQHIIGVQRKKLDTLGRTVIQFPFAIDDNTVSSVLSAIDSVLCCYPTVYSNEPPSPAAAASVIRDSSSSSSSSTGRRTRRRDAVLLYRV